MSASQLEYFMEARMLSLFDDEDFLPQEKPKPAKPKKSVEPKESTVADTEEEKPAEAIAPATAETEAQPIAAADEPAIQDTETQSDEPEAESEPVPEATAEMPAEPVFPETITENIPVAAEAEPEPIPEATAEIPAEPVFPETITENIPVTEEAVSTTEEATEPVAQEEELPAAEVAVEPEPAPVAASRSTEDDELNRQIIGEIMLNDYSAFIHKEYPFDLKSVEVVKKDKVVKVQEPARKNPEPVSAASPAAEEEEEEDTDEPMAPLPEWNLDKRYYTIGEVSQLFKVNTSHIRFWTNEFKLRPRTTRKGDRLYSPEDIAQLRLIHHLVKEKKHTIKGAKEKLKTGKEAVGNKLDLKDSLVSLKDMLIRIKDQL